MSENDSNDLECRVCRTTNEGSKLYAPCKCDGSIRYVHQECLEMWLRHKNSGVEVCELCGHTYTFKPRYADGAPSSLGGLSLATVLIRRVFTMGIPWLSRMICVFWSWLIIVPLATSWILKLVVQSPLVADTWSFQSIKNWLLHEIFGASGPSTAHSLADSDQMKGYIQMDLITGAVVTLVILTCTIILMSFLDFMRFQRVPEAAGGDVPFVMEPRAANREGNVDDRNHNRGGRFGRIGLGPAGRAHIQWHFADRGERGQLDPTFEETSGSIAASAGGGDDVAIEPTATVASFDHLVEDPSVLIAESELRQTEDEKEEEVPNQEIEEGDLNPWQFPEDWDYTHGTDQSLAAFKNVDDFYAWFNQSMESGENTGSSSDKDSDNGSNDSDDNDEQNVPLVDEQEDLNDEDLEALDPDAMPGGEVDIRGVLLDILGIRGPLNTMAKNLIFLIIFNAIFLSVFASIPCNLGAFIISFGKTLWPRVVTFLHPSITDRVSFVWSCYERVLSLSMKLEGESVDPRTLGNMLVGYLTLLILVFAADRARELHKLISAYSPGRVSRALKAFDNAVSAITTVVKVGFLLFLRVFLTPTVLGLTLLASYNVLAQYDEDAWLGFFCRNFVGALMLTWAMGICNMLIVTLTVLQLREVLHPDILAKIIRPQEPHLDLLNSLMNESGIVHIRRLFISQLVYLFFIVIFLLIPANLLAEKVSGIPSEIWRVRVWYGVPQIQVVMETSVVLAVFLSMLETHKNVIGKVLFSWFRRATDFLGLKRYFMPLSYEVVALQPTHPHYLRYPRHTMYVVAQSPMKRPPSKWDSKNFEGSGRWAWGNEIPGPVECQVAPRLTEPSFCVLRIFLLVAISWVVVVLFVLACIPAPLIYGRFLLLSLGIPPGLRHDVLAMAAGLCGVISYLAQAWRASNGWLRKVCDPCTGISYILMKLRGLAVSALLATTIGFPYTLCVARAHDVTSQTPLKTLLGPGISLRSFVAGNFFLDCLFFFAKSSLRMTLSNWLDGNSHFFSITLAQPSPLLKRKLFKVVLVELFAPIAIATCSLCLLDSLSNNYEAMGVTSVPKMVIEMEVVPLLLRACGTVLLISVTRHAGRPILDIVNKLLQLFHDSAYSERYLTGRELNNRTPEQTE